MWSSRAVSMECWFCGEQRFNGSLAWRKAKVRRMWYIKTPEPDNERPLPPAAVWDFRNLLVREGLTAELPELHSTPWSSAQALDPAHPKAQEFGEQRSIQRGTSIELDLDTLLSQKYSGETDTVPSRSSALNREEHRKGFVLKPVSLVLL